MIDESSPRSGVTSSDAPSAEQNAAQTKGRAIPQPGIDFLLSDIETARVFVQYDIASSDRRIDLLLTIASAFGAGLVILSQAQIATRDFLYLTFVAAASLLVVGSPILFEVIHNDANAVDHIRALNIMRNFFASHYPEIVAGIAMQRDRNFPTYNSLGRSRRMIPIGVNGMAGAVAGVAAYMIYNGRARLDYQEILLAMAIFAVLFVVQSILTSWRFRVIEKDIANSKAAHDQR